MIRLRPMWKLSVSALLVTIVGFSVGQQRAIAGPVTGTPTAPPLESAVYQGVVGIVPGGVGDSILELGNQGKDIASTGDLYFRPQRIQDANAAVRFTKNGATGKTDVHVYGRLCLNGSCLDAWPTPGGTSYWKQTSPAILEPLTIGRGLYTDTDGANGWGDYGLEVFGANTDGALYISKTTAGGNAIDIGYDLQAYGDLNATGSISMLGCLPGNGCLWPDGYSVATVWHPGNDGMGSGLDAGLIEGVDFYFCRPNIQDTKCNTLFSSQWEVCGEFEAGNFECVKLP